MKLLQWVARGAVLAFLSCASMAAAQEAQDGVIVTGEGVVTVAPDMAVITLGVTEVGATAKDAMAEVSGAVAAIIAKLDTLGIPPAHRQTSRFFLRPVYERQKAPENGQSEPPQIIGYEAGNSVTLRVEDLTRLGAIMDSVVAEGANDFNGLSFGLQDESFAMAEARKLAVADAQARADQLAEAAGIKLGLVRKITENSNGHRPMMMEMAQARGGFDAPVEAGELTLRAQVTMTFSIAPGI